MLLIVFDLGRLLWGLVFRNGWPRY